MTRLPALVALGLALGLLPLTVHAQTGEFRMGAGLAAGLGSDGLAASPVGIASFSFVKSTFSLGPEVLYVPGDQRIFGIGGVARLRIGAGRFRPRLIAGLGGNYWKQEDFGTTGVFSASVGAGISLTRPSAAGGFTLEARWHKNLQRIGNDGNWDFATVVAGLRLGW